MSRLERFRIVRDRRLAENDRAHTQRIGQVLFNALHEVEPELADEIRGTEDDCFYDDSRVPEFMGVVCYRLGDGSGSEDE